MQLEAIDTGQIIAKGDDLRYNLTALEVQLAKSREEAAAERGNLEAELKHAKAAAEERALAAHQQEAQSFENKIQELETQVTALRLGNEEIVGLMSEVDSLLLRR